MNWHKLRIILFENPVSKGITWLISGIFILLIKFYQLSISPLLPNSCRFTPSCSEYAMQALKTHGAVIGLVLGIYRIGRCNPWGGHGFDPVPEKGKAWKSFRKDSSGSTNSKHDHHSESDKKHNH